MKKFSKIIAFLLVFSLLPAICYAEFVYPTYIGTNQNELQITERINIVFDNSGHEDVKSMLNDVLMGSVVAENSAVWIYPIAGNFKPIRVMPGKEFLDSNFTAYSKSSNEFKTENVMETAMADLIADSSVSKKRFVLYVDDETAEKRSEYSTSNGLYPYFPSNPDILFSVFYSKGYMLEKRFMRGANNDETTNIEYLSDSSFFNFMLVKNGYSVCDYVYDQKNGMLKIGKGQADNNIFVVATQRGTLPSNIGINFPAVLETETETVSDIFSEDFSSDENSVPVYIGGAMMDAETHEKYLKKSKVKGVALSYNHTIIETRNQVAALFTADGTTINPLEEDIYIPVVNATEVLTYYRSTKGSGVCSAETSYNTKQDKDVYNYFLPKETEEVVSEEEVVEVTLDPFSKNGTETQTPSETKSVFKTILNVVLYVIGKILKILTALIRLAIFAFVILMIVNRKFRSYIQLKILNTKYGPLYEKMIIKIKKIITDIAGAGAKIRGDADLKGDYVFISKASADMGLPNNRITLLVRELESRGISCWLSENGIKAGQDYNVVLPQAIKSCTLFLLFVSPMSVKSSEVVSEIGTAKEHKKTIVPVQIEPFDLFNEFPNWAYMLKQYQKTDLFSSKEDEIKALADQVESIFNSLKK